LAWTVRLAVAAEKTLLKLDPPVARRIVKKLDDIAAGDPRRIGDALQGDERAGSEPSASRGQRHR
jgi:mRNA interferase RelE/StbE